MKQNYVLLTLLLTAHCVTSQKKVFKIPDSLENKSYVYLEDRSYSLTKDTAKAFFYINIYIKKAKNEENWKELVNGYQNALHQSPNNIRLQYADSMIYAAKKRKDAALIGSAYLSKGIVFYSQKKLSNALDNYIIANNYIAKTNDAYLIHKVKYNMGQVKYYLGFYDEAISLLTECVAYYKNENPRPYLNSLHSLGLCYNKIGNYGLCTETNKIGISESKRLKTLEMTPYFIHSDGINEYFMKNYDVAIKKIESSLIEINQKKDYANVAVGNFYIGKSFWQLEKSDKAVSYFKKVDRTFQDKGYIRPDLLEVYQLLIAYYKTKDNLKAQLFYIDQLLAAVKTLKETNKYLIGKVHKEYDTKVIVTEKDKMKAELLSQKYNDTIFISIIVVFFAGLLFMTYRHFKNRAVYKQKFNELMVQIKDENRNKTKLKNDKSEILDINADTVNNVLKQLDKFEREKKFLEKDITLVKLAAAFNSNNKYLSKIIAHYKEKGFVEYINALKIDYLINLLQEDKRIRNYTNKALAEEAGFSSTQRFANAFLTKTGMPTSFFIEQLKKGNT
ncbi:AraC family transcriptional regulator [Flavobacterium psychrolimnae]|uniref:AraC family transcriptional regulator n=1 Tax=Flavobacterium psychrolimnae TaxID=249351 RepID=A0A366AX65_9FLAO|nr:AraC family transcriptional regulator [Flavobacterium psychrolimnae]RBN49460.1 AraC family transcriptional regulator [Flavobacterium psychrolimnae]